MATFPVFCRVGYLDSAERISERRYRLLIEYDDVAENFDDVVVAANALETALNVLTWDHIEYNNVEVQFGGGGAAANAAANNQIIGFTRTNITSTSEPSFFEVPAWDDLTFDQDSNNLLSAAYNTAAAAVAALTVDAETGLAWTVQWSQSRTRKSGVKLS